MLKRIIFGTLAALAISACAPSGGDGEDKPSHSPFGYEFAQVAQGAEDKARTRK